MSVTHVFVLMLENRSFDNLFGMSGIPGIITEAPGNKNTFQGIDYPVQKGAPFSMPTDPGHEFDDVVVQLAGVDAQYPPGGDYPTINNSGFAASYATTTTEGPVPGAANIGDIMKCFDTSVQLPVIYQLATEFALCDHWFSSMPGPTWPNRFFVHGASSAGLDHSPSKDQVAAWEGNPLGGFTYPNGSIYDALNHAGIAWRIYNDTNGPLVGRIPQVTSLKGVSFLRVHPLARLGQDLQGSYPYRYTFIEPNYGNIANDTYAGGSSQHPMDSVIGGEKLIKTVYETIRNSPLWLNSLLVITYDEHGGFYDSIAPNNAVAPDDGASDQLNNSKFTFKQYGVRVPAVIVSPLIPKGVVDHTVYDHSSIPATLERLFGFPALTQRDAQANDLQGLLTLSTPRDTPTTLNNPASVHAAFSVTAAQRPAAPNEPLPKRGVLPSMLGVMLKTELELAGPNPADRTAIHARFNAIKTKAQAKAYIESVMAKADAVKMA
ncbi:MAG TPA: alkaline phosphatase family protein [Gemmataceae bacterium]|nr:alkaline phosphatase family protein [Gemmataceae bacterium]